MKSTWAFPLLTMLLSGCGTSPAGTGSQLKVHTGLSCTIKTANGNFVTAVGGGGRITDVLHTNASVAHNWEKFTLVAIDDDTPLHRYAIKTFDGHYLSAVDGGGLEADALHSDSIKVQAWEQFALIGLEAADTYAIQTSNGHYLTAVSGGGRSDNQAIKASLTAIEGPYLKFKFNCGL